MCKKLYSSLVRPHLEFVVQSGSPYIKEGIVELEEVQQRMTKLVPELKELNYEEQCSIGADDAGANKTQRRFS